MRKFINWLTGRDIRRKLDTVWLTGRDIRRKLDTVLSMQGHLHEEVRARTHERYIIHNLTKRLKASSAVLEAAMSAKRKEQS